MPYRVIWSDGSESDPLATIEEAEAIIEDDGDATGVVVSVTERHDMTKIHAEATPAYWDWVTTEHNAGRMTTTELRLRHENAHLALETVGDIVASTIGLMDEIEVF